MFVDVAKISVKAGKGGDGAVSFHREKYVATGGPDGGDGGKGGNIVFLVDDNLSTLIEFRYKKKYTAEVGENGGAKNCSGRGAKDLIIKVPRGTLVKDAATGRLLADMSEDEPTIIAKGGKGGAGNQHFATPTRQIPRFAKPGKAGEEFDLTLELKLLADVGLVGFPNVGKSTLISVVSAAKPKIANYHFTTLVPVLGVVRISSEESFVMADIPGLIEGASDGVGLGHDFLRHIDRCRLIVHIVDVSGSEGRDPVSDFELINKELKNYNEDISTRPQIVVGSKIDLATDEQIAEFKSYIEGLGYPFFTVCAPISEGCQQLVYEVAQRLRELPPIVRFEAEEAPIETTENKGEIKITRADNGAYVIDAPWIYNLLLSADMDDYESLHFFQKVLIDKGVIARLEEMGINEGDTVRIEDFEFDYVR